MKKYFFFWSFALVFIFRSPFIFAQNTNSKDTLQYIYVPVKQEEKQKNWVILPAVVYSPETKFGFGGLVMKLFKLKGADSTTRTSNFQTILLYTTENQVVFSNRYFIFFPQEKYLIRGSLGYFKFPEFYFGIGSETPSENKEQVSYQLINVETRFLSKISKGLFLGFEQRFFNMWQVERKTSGLLDSTQIAGYDGSLVSGLGPALMLDSRDNINNPSKGAYGELMAFYHGRELGSKFTFSRFLLDYRKYFNVYPTKRHILALQFRSIFNVGTAPFKQLAEFGGDMITRGYYRGRYRDKHIMAVQAEYRMPVWKMFGLTGFFCAGDVAGSLSEFSFNTVKLCYGGGLRIKINPKENINARIDFGMGKGGSGFYFGLTEAF